MSDFCKRTIFGAVFAVTMLGSIWVHFILFFIVMAFVVLKGSEEMSRLFPNKAEKPLKCQAPTMALLLYFFIACFAYFSFPIKYISFLIIFPLIPFIVALFSKRHDFLHIAGCCWTSMLFVALPSGLMTMFLGDGFSLGVDGKILLTMMFVLVWTNDIFAYLTGKAIGKHKLFERISPKKTVEGSLGGAAITVLAAFLANRFWLHLMSSEKIMGLAFTIVVFGSLGDLCESMLKRQAGVKDSGNVIPGHGGILDRFDASFLAMPFAFVYLTLIVC